MIVRGENVKYVAEGANRYTMNLSGKKTRTGRNSGERCYNAKAATKGESL